MKPWKLTALVLAALVAAGTGVWTQEPTPGQKPTLYVISNSHLDTQWNWTVQDTIRDLVPATFFDNFKLFDRFPRYAFNYEGAIHYMWFKEYHPDAWPTLRKHVASGRWRLAGSWINAADTHVPSPESLMRQALYAKRFQRQEFGRVSHDVYLPDCFGFGFALPSIAANSGLISFSTQKLSWGAAFPPPFAVGRWKGVDGSTIVAALRGGDYVMKLTSDVSIDPKWSSDLVDIGGGRKVGFRYFGVGDQGGAPDAQSVEWLEKAMANEQGAVRVVNTSADQLARDLTPEQKAALPEYEGELLLKTHGVGCYTSQAAMKQWNRRNELLADAAERASVAAEWLGGPAYPAERLRTAWIRFLWHQFHDDLTGTSIPQAYQFSWNDELVSQNQFAAILHSAVASVTDGLDTRVKGLPLVVFNPLSFARRDPVEATVAFPVPVPAAVVVTDVASGQTVPAQVLSRDASGLRIVFLASVPSVGFKVFDVAPAKAVIASSLRVTASSLESDRYAVKINADGDISSIVDKQAGGELLRAPSRLELFDDVSTSWPAWEITYAAVSKGPRAAISSPTIRIVERGPARVALQVSRSAEGSTFVQRISLAEGSDRVEVETDVDWKTPGTLLKATFPLVAAAEKATYDLGLGTIQRGNSRDTMYEVPGQQWADITDAGGRPGAAVLNDSKYGWDKPADHLLRLSLLHTPRPKSAYVYQSSNDLGRHRFVYAVAGHAGDWRDGQVPSRAARLNQPLVAFQAAPHGGPLGASFSMLGVKAADNQVLVKALKKAEDGDELIVRVQELYGRAAKGVEIALPAGVVSVREVNAAEEAKANLPAAKGRLVVDLAPYQSRSFAVKAGEPASRVTAPSGALVSLPFDGDGISLDADRSDGDFDGTGRTLAGELLPATLEIGGLPFAIGPTGAGAKNVLSAAGQRIEIPSGHDRLYILAAAVGGDASGVITLDGPTPRRVNWRVQDWASPIGQWNSRLTDEELLKEVYVAPTKDQSWTLDAIQEKMVTRFDPATGAVSGIEKIRPGFLKRDEVAWVGTHRHSSKGNEPYILTYIFKYAIDLPAGARAVVLPKDDRIRIFAMTVADDSTGRTRPAGLLYAPELAAPAAARR